MNFHFTKYFGLVVLVTVAGALHAETPKKVDSGAWPQFRGSNNGIAPALPVTDVSKAKITKLWTVPTENGFSSFAVAGTQALTVVTRNGKETLVSLDIKSGKELWAQALDDAKYDGGGNAGTRDNQGGDGARCTPAVNEGRVYVIGSQLTVFCFDAKDGKMIWSHDVQKENGGKNIHWQNAASPVIDGDILLLAGGGKGQALLGLDKKTGAVKWKGEDDTMTHATPILADILGTHQCIFFTQTGLVSVTPQDGKVLWRAPFPYKTSTAASPVVSDDIVYCSAGYGVGAGAFKISKSGSDFTATELWRKEGDKIANHWSTPVVKDGYLYGMFSFKKYGEGPLACVDIKTGDVKWEQAGYGPGQVILSGDTLIALTDKGEVVFVKADPAKYTELKREALITGKIWSYPVLAYNHIFARSTKEGGCWELK
ncbi:MAG: PQQ-like beta-propeller repeat protein [Verrucomicrobia bacterium]|nr:PQQ-like beta-propeller repeat protein [Verrucomicrobiota bacterium]